MMRICHVTAHSQNTRGRKRNLLGGGGASPPESSPESQSKLEPMFSGQLANGENEGGGSSSSSGNYNYYNNSSSSSTVATSDALPARCEGALSPWGGGRDSEVVEMGASVEGLNLGGFVTLKDVEELVKITGGLQLQVKALLIENERLGREESRLRSSNAELSCQKVALDGANRQLVRVGDELRFEEGELRREVRVRCARTLPLYLPLCIPPYLLLYIPLSISLPFKGI